MSHVTAFGEMWHFSPLTRRWAKNSPTHAASARSPRPKPLACIQRLSCAATCSCSAAEPGV